MVARIFRRAKRINLALQGGGAHGAFTWGVLDRFLTEPNLRLGWLSGTSAGAVNAVAVAHGLTHGNRTRARETLAELWSAVESAGVPDLIRLNPFWSSFAKAASYSNITSVFSPYTLNPLGFDPLRNVLLKHIDFDAIREASPIDLVIAATDVQTGRARLFRRDELTIDVVLASACLPTLHHAVVIDGRPYWDGGFSANPDLLTVVSESPVRDTLLVQLNPIAKPGLPTRPDEIEDRVNTLTFNQPLLRDIETIVMAQKMRRSILPMGRSFLGRLRGHRYHFISSEEHTSGLGVGTKAMPDNGLLTSLRAAGHGEADTWIAAHKRDIGWRSTIDWSTSHYTQSGRVEELIAPQPTPTERAPTAADDAVDDAMAERAPVDHSKIAPS